MSDTLALVMSARALRAARTPFVTATVVDVVGSGYRQPGARMIMDEETWLVGSVSGGCLEKDVIRKAWWRTNHGRPMLLTYDASDGDALAVRLGCNGTVRVLLERFVPPASDPLLLLDRSWTEQRAAARVIVFRAQDEAVVGACLEIIDGQSLFTGDVGGRLGAAMRREGERALSERRTYVERLGESVGALVEYVVPPPHLFVCGTGHDVVSIAAAAEMVGWEVTVCAPSASATFSLRARFSRANIASLTPPELRQRVDMCHRAVAVVMSHDLETDRAWLRTLLDSRALYIGALGPRRRTERLIGDMSERHPRLHAPAGLDLGGESPAEVALSIVAEIQAELAGGSAAPLHGTTAIHRSRRAFPGEVAS